MARADKARKNSVRLESVNGLAHFPVSHTSGPRARTMSTVRMKVARSASTSCTPTLAKTAVSAAKQADRIAQLTQPELVLIAALSSDPILGGTLTSAPDSGQLFRP